MSKQRYIKDSFWTDPYIEKLSPDYKLIFLYLLTNPLSNIAGVYEVRLKRMAYETGYDTEVVENIIKKFVKDFKIIQFNDWIVIVNHIKHQSLGNLTAEGINRVIKESPQEIQDLFEEKTLTNSKNEEYSVMVLKEYDIPLTSPLQAPTNGAYSEVKLSRVKLSKIKYGEFQNVLLKDEEYKNLLEKLGESNTKLMIEELSTYIASKGKRYSNHYATLLGWARRKVQNHQEKLSTKKIGTV
jgi:hypothetical protein